MPASTLNAEQIKMLESNPNVARITPKTILYTQTFKRFFCEEYFKGKMPRRIVKEAGFDPKVLGQIRINSLRWHALKAWRDGGNFIDDTPKKDSPRKSHFQSAKTLEGKLIIMHHELVYTQQELEFLKKIFIANTKAQQKLKKRQSREKSSQLSSRCCSVKITS